MSNKSKNSTTTTTTAASGRGAPAAVNTTSEGLVPIGVDILELQSKLLGRPARKQQEKVSSRYEEHDVDTTEYNIWYGKKLGQKRSSWRDNVASETRCNLLKDCGKTKAGKNTFFCLHFAKGRCVNGQDCNFYHRIPTADDDRKLDMAHDIFGRERHKTDREDMGGVGSFSRDNRTLFIGGIKAFGSTIDEVLRRHFEEWGPIEYVRSIPSKSIAFVRYLYRSSAEFAKESMASQSLESGDLLNIRWANEDVNPHARKIDEKNFQKVAIEVVNKRLKEMTPENKATLTVQMTEQYPNTDSQYLEHNNSSSTNQEEDSSGVYQIPQGSGYEIHPYAKIYNKTLEEKKSKGLLGDEVKPLGKTVGNYFSHQPNPENINTSSSSSSYINNNNNNNNNNSKQPKNKKLKTAATASTNELDLSQYEEYLTNYYKSYGYDYSQLTDDQKKQLIQYSQTYYENPAATK